MLSASWVKSPILRMPAIRAPPLMVCRWRCKTFKVLILLISARHLLKLSLSASSSSCASSKKISNSSISVSMVSSASSGAAILCTLAVFISSWIPMFDSTLASASILISLLSAAFLSLLVLSSLWAMLCRRSITCSSIFNEVLPAKASNKPTSWQWPASKAAWISVSRDFSGWWLK